MAAFDMRVVSYLNIKEMTKRGGSINSTVRRRLLMCGHGKFRNLLLQLCAHPAAPRNDGVLLVTEHHTSHLCSNCHRFNGYVGSSRSFKCPGCLCHFDRDANAARNILMAALMSLLTKSRKATRFRSFFDQPAAVAQLLAVLRPTTHEAVSFTNPNPNPNPNSILTLIVNQKTNNLILILLTLTPTLS